MSKQNETGIRDLPPLSLPPIIEAPPPIAKPVSEPSVVLAEVVETPKPPPDRAKQENGFHTVLAWIARFVVGVCMISNAFPLSFITAIAAFGWLQRRMQAIALRAWWRESPRRLEGTFQDFCDTLGPNAPVERPRWFWRERIVKTLNRERRGGAIRRYFSTLADFVTLPFHSLYLNLKVGIAGLFSTYMITGWPCSIMLFSWYFGWLNSFHKGYEDAFLGLGFGLLGSFLLILTLVYVPMAQAHQATTGEVAAFFQFRVVTRLILTRLTAYTILLAGLALTSLVFEIPRLMTAGENFGPNQQDVTPQDAYWMLERHWFAWSLFFFFALLVLRTLSAVIYRSAMLKAIRTGILSTTDLPPRLALWFEKLEILPQAQLPQHPVASLLRATLSLKWRFVLFAAVFVILLLFVMRFYGGYFFVFNEYRGILNHPVFQVPTIDWTPWHLVMGLDE